MVISSQTKKLQIGFGFLYTKRRTNPMVKAIRTAEFEEEVIKAEGLVVVDLYADWCGPCKAMAPVLESLSEDFEDVKFTKVNVDQNPEIAAKYRVQNIPNFLFIKNGELADQLVGVQDADSFEEVIEKNK
jgi:thioredoxin 1